MKKTPQELLKAYVESQKFSSTTEIMGAMKEMFRDVLQQVMESELETELGYEKSQRVSDPRRRKEGAELPEWILLKDGQNPVRRGRGQGSPGPEWGI